MSFPTDLLHALTHQTGHCMHNSTYLYILSFKKWLNPESTGTFELVLQQDTSGAGLSLTLSEFTISYKGTSTI